VGTYEGEIDKNASKIYTLPSDGNNKTIIIALFPTPKAFRIELFLSLF